jgi:formylglycine-generating enzyme required for sulfatase activity
MALAGALSLVPGPACTSGPPPFPQATLAVDTDLPVPRLASRLRVDVYDERGAWRSSRDFAVRDAGDFPASFAVFFPDEGRTGDVLVRLRLRPDDADRDYRGERYRPFPTDDARAESVVRAPAGDDAPRLMANGADVTPPFEPLPEITVDRLVRVRLTPGVTSRPRVMLRAACMGRMANLADGTSCVDADRPYEPTGTGDGEDDGRPTAAGTSLALDAIEPPPPPPGAVAVRGGALVLGGSDLDVGLPATQVAPNFPPRAAIVRGFAIDREEVSVARLRAALAAGFAPGPGLNANDAPLATSAADPRASCTYRSAPDPADPGREALPLTCVGFDVARAFCRHEAGDLPTEAQWEYAAALSGRAHKTRYPWGNDTPTCKGIVFARSDQAVAGSTGCHDRGFPFGLREAPTVDVDITPDGIRNLAGAVSEWVRGAPFAYDSACYLRAGLVDPLCDAPSKEHVLRGGSFTSNEADLAATSRGRVPAGGSTPTIGFRCVYER